MRIEQFLLGILMFGLFVAVMYSLLASNVAEYSSDVDTTKLEKFSNQLDPVMNETSEFEENLRGDGVSEENAEDSLFKGGFKAASNIWNSVSIMANLTNEIAVELGAGDEHDSQILPKVAKYLILMMGILLVVGLLYLVFRFQPK